jgi:DNA polymerase III delta prime subunit
LNGIAGLLLALLPVEARANACGKVDEALVQALQEAILTKNKAKFTELATKLAGGDMDKARELVREFELTAGGTGHTARVVATAESALPPRKELFNTLVNRTKQRLDGINAKVAPELAQSLASKRFKTLNDFFKRAQLDLEKLEMELATSVGETPLRYAAAKNELRQLYLQAKELKKEADFVKGSAPVQELVQGTLQGDPANIADTWIKTVEQISKATSAHH